MSAGIAIAMESLFATLFRVANKSFGYEPHYGQPTIYKLNTFNLPIIRDEQVYEINLWFEEFKAKVEEASLPMSSTHQASNASISSVFGGVSTRERLFKYHLSLDGDRLAVSTNGFFGRDAIQKILGSDFKPEHCPSVSIHAENNFPPDEPS